MFIMIMASCCIGRSRLLRSVTREAASFPSSSSLLLPQILYSTITLPTYIHTQSLYTTLLNVARTYHPRHKKSQVTIYTQSGALGAYKWRNSCLVRNFRLQCSVEVPLLPSELPRGSEDEEVATQAPSPAYHPHYCLSQSLLAPTGTVVEYSYLVSVLQYHCPKNMKRLARKGLLQRSQRCPFQRFQRQLKVRGTFLFSSNKVGPGAQRTDLINIA